MGRANKLGFWILTALVVGNMVGSGIFMLPRSLAEAASPAGTVLAWAVTGFGVLMLALVFGNLALRKPELNGGPQIYAKELFASRPALSLLSGFMSSWGYWIGNIAGFVAVVTTFASYLSTFVPAMNDGGVLLTLGSFELTIGHALNFAVCSLLLWATHFLALRGIEGAGRINLIATATKVIGFAVFIGIALFAFRASNIGPFAGPHLNEAGRAAALPSQVNGAAVVTLWAFIGVESATVFAARAKRKADVSRATVAGLAISLVLYVGISILTMGLLPQADLVNSQNPLVDAMTAVLGSYGGYLLAGLGLVSLIGSTIGWVLLSAEVPYEAARQRVFLQPFRRENGRGMPKLSLWISNGLGQLLIFSTVSGSISQAFDFIIVVATLAYLVPYLIASVYQLKLTLTGESYARLRERRMDGAVAALATVYSVWVIYAGTSDWKTFLFGVLLLASGIVFYPLLRRQLRASETEAAGDRKVS
ncbi:amino acid permease [Saccharibacillus sp. CPCC 101409]|uniref:amino acid permease n=1 Tax=Saccharibacillus sp. CPCC 101409 TaxID=3058041 RepID=UPI0026738027|nr:amino acid permease [Saccharibacillus sp. CPCC 101409]MDO3411991.1 amino acid permease [Saccharibacillus sp. CPCC 101409]